MGDIGQEPALVRVLKAYMLPFAIATGTLVFFAFESIPALEPWRDPLGSLIGSLMPLMIFLMLFFAFLKIRPQELLLMPWHWWLILAEFGSAVLLCVYLYAAEGLSAESVALWHAMLACLVSPTAAAVAVLVGKLGGSGSRSTSYILLSNVATAICVPLLFPLARHSLEFNFLEEFLQIMSMTIPMLIVPLVTALALKYFAPDFSARLSARSRDLSFWIWVFTLTSVAGTAVAKIYHAPFGTQVVCEISLVALLATALHFALGKLLGHPYHYRVTAGQCLGQKNMVFGIYITTAYLSEAAVIGAGWYLLWQNLVNAWQMAYKVRLDRRAAERGEAPYQE